MNAGAPLAVEALGLSKTYRGVPALADLTMTVSAGEVFGFLGPNGAGKTTAVKVLLGLVRPTAGAAEVLGAPLGDLDARRALGYLPELFRYQEWLTGREVLALHANLAALPPRRQAAAVDESLELVGLAARGGDRVGTYSKGMQQRLGLGVALIGDPRLVFLDEPTSALDPVGRQDVRRIIEGLRSRGTAVFLNSHLLTEVERVCDRVAVVDRGRVVALDSLDALLGRKATVRLRLGAAGPAARDILARYGGRAAASDEAATEEAADEPPRWYALSGVVEPDVPRLVADLVAAGAQVYAVAPERPSLEDRFIELLSPPAARADDRRPDPT